MANPTTDKILDTAEGLIRVSGYNAFSFREVAALVGVKSASVHYHFPTKADLAAAVAKRYSVRFFGALQEQIQTSDPLNKKLDAYVGLFRQALKVDKKLCLCGMLGAEKASLPAVVIPQITAFFKQNIDWLSRLLADANESADAAKAKAATLFASLEGALILAQTLDDHHYFELIQQQAVAGFLR